MNVGTILIYLRVGRNPYAFCLHHIRMWMKTETRRPSDSTAGATPLASKDQGLLVLLSVLFEIP